MGKWERSDREVLGTGMSLDATQGRGREFRGDVEFLIRRLGYHDPEQVFRAIGSFCPGRAVPPKARFLVEELPAAPETPSD